jgi:hypothetical protein
MYIGLAGQAQMGKDTVADHLAKVLNERINERTQDFTTPRWGRTAFADNVKKVYQDTFDRDRAFIEEWKVKPECPPGFDKTVRESLQFIGDGFRTICPTIWVDLVFRPTVIEGVVIPKKQIISDVRYVNEFKRVKKEGGLNILVGRSDRLNDDPNGSEAQIRPYVKWFLDATHPPLVKVENLRGENVPLDIWDFDLFIRNDGTIEELYEAIEEKVVPYVEQYFGE